MEQIDGTLLKMIFSVIGFVIIALIAIITWLFKTHDKHLQDLAKSFNKMELTMVAIQTGLGNVKTLLDREIELIRNDHAAVTKKVDQNTDDISEIKRDLGAVLEWKKGSEKK